MSAEITYKRMYRDVPLLSAATAAPDDNLVAVEPDLEDVHFSTMAGYVGQRRKQLEVVS